MALEPVDGESLLRHVNEISALLKKQFEGELLSSEELQKLESWKKASEHNTAIFERVSNEESIVKDLMAYHKFSQEFDLTNEETKADLLARVGLIAKKTTTWFRWLAAASILVFISTALYYFARQEKNTSSVDQSRLATADILPASNRAILTLSNGSTVALDSLHNGVVATEDATTIKQSNKGELVYNSSASVVNDLPALYNTITTPRGGKFQLTLPDGTRVWLNAASSLHYPVRFSGSERRVTLEGEAYFEVKHDAGRPFTVSLNAGSSKGEYGYITVLGTHFNAKAYQEDKYSKVTLLEGSVSVSKVSSIASTATLKIKPGEQAALEKKGDNSITVTIQDKPLNSIAWVNNKFVFQHATLAEIAQELSRWYDIDFDLKSSITAKTISGEISRDMPLSQLLSSLHFMTDMEFQAEGRKVTVGK